IASGSSQPGAVVVTVQPGGPDSKAGISAGDLIEKIDGNAVADATDLGTAQPITTVQLAGHGGYSKVGRAPRRVSAD
ncbi:MAG TPA: PDZ domain-containing protein, partial [Solirubrobacteraceae bacterium]|nr:PDZ domain-containing protein [Solirubrobacteraceae bacterium]